MSQSTTPPLFTYERAFARTIGWITEREQACLRGKRIAIAGMGGVGGVHLLTLARLGIGSFHIADFDTFGLANMNRQAGASLSTLGKPKVEVLASMARDINPELHIKAFPLGVNEVNVDAFLEGVDLYVDGLDFFAFEARKSTFEACARLQVPATTAAPLGMGAALVNFSPSGMSFEEYFQWGRHTPSEKAIRFLLGLAPVALHRRYLVDPSVVRFSRQAGPSTPMACELCAGIAGTEALKILLGRGRVRYAPHSMQFDAYRGRLVNVWRPGGNRHPLQRLAIKIARRQLQRMERAADGGSDGPARSRS